MLRYELVVATCKCINPRTVNYIIEKRFNKTPPCQLEDKEGFIIWVYDLVTSKRLFNETQLSCLLHVLINNPHRTRTGLLYIADRRYISIDATWYDTIDLLNKSSSILINETLEMISYDLPLLYKIHLAEIEIMEKQQNVKQFDKDDSKCVDRPGQLRDDVINAVY